MAIVEGWVDRMGGRVTRNAYTTALFLVGCYSLYAMVTTFRVTNWASYLIMFGMSVILSFFPIRFPSGIRVGNYYSTATLGFMFILMHMGVGPCLLGLLIDTLIVTVRRSGVSLRGIRWFRILSTMGMYYMCVLAVHVYLIYAPHQALWLKSILAFLIFDGINQLLLLGIYHSLGEPIRFSLLNTLAREVAVPLFICSALLSTVLKPAPPWPLAWECLYAVLILSGIIYITHKHSDFASMHESMAKKYRTITDNTDDLIALISPKLEIDYASPAHDGLLQLSANAIEGRQIDTLVDPDDLSTLKRALTDCVVYGTPFTQRVHLLAAEGDAILVEMKGAPIAGEYGEPNHVVTISRDLSEFLRSEEMLRKSERLAVVGQLAAGVAHEIRNPLTSIKGFLKLITRNPEDITRFSPIIWAEFSHIESVIHEFLVWSKPQFGQKTEGHVGSLIASVVSIMEAQALMNNVHIHVAAKPNLPPILCDATHLKQVFVNVLKNAMEAMPDGGRVTIDISQEEAYVVTTITDEGYGIAPENLAKIGDPFFTTKADGTGLGMMVSFKILDDHGGTMSFQSDGLRGTTVRIQLPAVSQETWIAASPV